jgi:predicted RNA-binding protein with PUA-like domain
MAYWLLKSEPEVFSWDNQVARGLDGEPWSGVRNHQAKNFIKAMKPGDQAFFYHTSDRREIVGIVDIVSAPYPDPEDGAWFAVTTVAASPFVRAVTLAQIKAIPELSEMALIKQSRLSVQPVTEAEWAVILELGQTAREVRGNPQSALEVLKRVPERPPMAGDEMVD